MKNIKNPNTTPIKEDLTKYRIRCLVDLMYDLQDTRIRTGNRVYQLFCTNENAINPETQETYDQAVILKMVREDYEAINARAEERGVKTPAVKDFAGAKFITNKAEYQLASVYVQSVELEEKQKSALELTVKAHPLWDKFFADIKGCGPAIAGVCIAYLDPHAARHVSSFWSYAGVGTLIDESGNRVAMCRRNLREIEYVDKDGETKTKKTIGYNSALHDKLLKVFCDCVIKAGGGSLTNAKSKYAKVYYDKKNYYANRYDGAEKSAMHIDRQARRCVVKEFLRDLWCEWRTLEGYTLSQPYEVEYLGRAPHEYNEAHYRKAS